MHLSTPPTQEETRKITEKIAYRMHRWLENCMDDFAKDALGTKEPLLAKCYSASIRYLSAMGKNPGKPLFRLISEDQIKGDNSENRTFGGFNLHASLAIGADDRRGLERTLRYMGRPPLSKDRLKKTADGKNLLLKLKSSWRDGTSHICLTPFELLERLVAIIPPPRKNQIRYHGFFGPNAKIRKTIISTAQAKRPEEKAASDKRVYRVEFAKLLSRVFGIDVLKCPKCLSKMQIISLITTEHAIRDILISLKMSTAPPKVVEPEQTIEYEYQADLFLDDVSFP